MVRRLEGRLRPEAPTGDLKAVAFFPLFSLQPETRDPGLTSPDPKGLFSSSRTPA